jgi:hypothetical protein
MGSTVGLPTPRLFDSSTSRLLDLVLCFHRHSRFVPPILHSTSGGIETLASPPLPSGLRSVACGRQLVSNSSTTICPPAHLPTCPCFCTPRLLDCKSWKQGPQAGTTGENKRGLSGMTYLAGLTPCPTPRNNSSLCPPVCQEKNAQGQEVPSVHGASSAVCVCDARTCSPAGNWL